VATPESGVVVNLSAILGAAMLGGNKSKYGGTVQWLNEHVLT
jgi:hypothetical protein